MAAASTRPATPSLARMLETCTPTVLGLMNNAWAIWRCCARPPPTQHLHLPPGQAQLLGRVGAAAAAVRSLAGGARSRRARRASARTSPSRAGAQAAGDGGGATQHLGGGVAVPGGQQRLGVAVAGVGGPVGLAQPLPGRDGGGRGGRVGPALLADLFGQGGGVPGGQLRQAGAGRPLGRLPDPFEQRGGGGVVGGRLGGVAGPGGSARSASTRSPRA